MRPDMFPNERIRKLFCTRLFRYYLYVLSVKCIQNISPEFHSKIKFFTFVHVCNANNFIYIKSRLCLLNYTLLAVGVCTEYRFEMWFWKRMEKISWTDHMRNKVSFRVNERRNILGEISKRKVNWIGHILSRNCLLRQVIEGKIKMG
jgi:predicted DNA-binding ribbon-helix-helix protein